MSVEGYGEKKCLTFTDPVSGPLLDITCEYERPYCEASADLLSWGLPLPMNLRMFINLLS